MENVPDVTKHEVYHDFVRGLKEKGYHIWADKVFCPELGVAQVRTRHVLLASKLGPISLQAKRRKPEEFKTVEQVIGKLPPISAGGQHASDPLHTASRLTEMNLERIRHSTPGGTWRDWPEHLLADCHRRESGKTYSGVYARMRADAPAPTMTTQCYGFGNGRFGHPTQDRGISLREAAIFQSFPKTYRFVEPGRPVHFKSVGRMIGNAVPPRLGAAIGRSFIAHLTGT
jgi:DNA (cytosine-5)-methyltransferase 1